MQMIHVTFTGVGAQKRTWREVLPSPLTFHSMYRSIKKHHALGSRDIEFADNGGIYVGGVRRVGSWSVE